MDRRGKLFVSLLLVNSWRLIFAQQTVPPELFSGPTNRPPPAATIPTTPPLATIPPNRAATALQIVPTNTPAPVATIPVQTVTVTNQVVETVTTNVILIPG